MDVRGVTNGARRDKIYRVRSFESRRHLSSKEMLKNPLRAKHESQRNKRRPNATGILRKRTRKENTRSAEICKVRVNRFEEKKKRRNSNFIHVKSVANTNIVHKVPTGLRLFTTIQIQT